jgi:hypothetical protein
VNGAAFFPLRATLLLSSEYGGKAISLRYEAYDAHITGSTGCSTLHSYALPWYMHSRSVGDPTEARYSA